MSTAPEPLLPSDVRKDVFRKVAGTAIENSHAAIKQVWVALFAGGTFQLIRSFDLLLGCIRGYDTTYPGLKVCEISFLADKTNYWLCLLLFPLYGVYILSFYRYYVGNIRIFDMRYIEVGRFVALLAEKIDSHAGKAATSAPDDRARLFADAAANKDQLYEKFFEYNEQQNRFRDSMLLMIKTLVIVGLTVEINSPTIFVSIYVFLLAFDLAWMTWSRLRQQWRDCSALQNASVHWTNTCRWLAGNPFFVQIYFERLGLDAAIGHEPDIDTLRRRLTEIFPSRAIKTWTWINAISLLMLVVIILLLFQWPSLSGNMLPPEALIALAEIVMLWNCVQDLYSTWGFYNPSFTSAHDVLLSRDR